MQNFYNSLVLAMLGPQADPADPKVALSPQLLYTYKALVADQSDLAKAYRSAETKQKLAELKNLVNIYSTAQKAQTAAYGEIAQSSRVSSQNITKLKDGAQKTLDRARARQTAVDKDKRRSIIEAGEAKAAYNNSTVEQTILHEATITSFASTDPLDPDNTKALGTISDILQRTVGAGLSEGDIVARVREFTEGSPLQNETMEKIIAYKTAYDETGRVTKKASSLLGSLESYGKELDGVTAGAPGSKEKIEAQNKVMKGALELYGDTLQASESAARASMEDVRDFYSDYLSTAAQYEEVLQAISDQIIGTDSSNKYRGELVSSPNFIAWAKDNGYENLGYMKGGTYVEGADDTNAIYLFKWQQMHPEKYKPGLVNDSGATDDLLVIEKAPSQKYLNSLMAGKNKKGETIYFVRLDKNGNKKYLSNDPEKDSLTNLWLTGGTRIETVRDGTIMADFNMEDINDSSSKLYEFMKEKLEKTGNTIEQFQAFNNAQPAKAAKMVLSDPAIIKALGATKVSIDGQVSPVGSSDDIAEMLEEFEVTEDSFRYVPPRSREFFVDDKEKGIKAIAPQVTATTDMPTEKRVVERQRMHAARNFTKDGVVVIGTDTYGEIKFDPSGKDGFSVSESYDTSDVGGRISLMEDPAERLTAAKIKRGEIDPDELASEVQFEEKVETEKQQKEREEQNVLGILKKGITLKEAKEGREKAESIATLVGKSTLLFTELPDVVGLKSRRRQKEQLIEEEAKRRAEGMPEISSALDLGPMYNKTMAGADQAAFNLGGLPEMTPFQKSRFAYRLPSGDDLPRLSPVTPDVASTQTTSKRFPALRLPRSLTYTPESEVDIQPFIAGEPNFFLAPPKAQVAPVSEEDSRDGPAVMVRGVRQPTATEINQKAILRLREEAKKRQARPDEFKEELDEVTMLSGDR
jgi:hypothetical protein